jgi:hypothetical protein
VGVGGGGVELNLINSNYCVAQVLFFFFAGEGFSLGEFLD